MDSRPAALLSFISRKFICPCHYKYWCKITPRYFTVEGKFIFFPFILKCKCLVIILCIWLKITISVLLVFKLILFALSHCSRRAKSWNCTRSAKSWFIKEFVSFSDLFINSRLVSSAKWCTLLDITDRYKSLINMINRRRSSTDPWGNPWVISWKFQSCYTCVLVPVCYEWMKPITGITFYTTVFQFC